MLYKIEFFTGKFEFLGFSTIQNSKIVFDAMTLEPTRLVVPSGESIAKKGNFASVTDEKGKVVFQGIVNNSETDGYKTTYLVKPLLSLFDVNVFFDRTQSHHLERFFAGIISDYFVNSTDILQNVTSLQVSAQSDTIGFLNIKDNVGNLYDMLLKSLKLYGVWCDVTFDAYAKKMYCNVKRNTNQATIEADLPSIADKSLMIGNSEGSVNKITIVNKLDEDEQLTFFRHTDGSVDTSNSDRVVPVVFDVSYLEQEEGSQQTFAESAYAKAFEHLKESEFDNEIKILVKNDSFVIDTHMGIGTSVDIISGNKIYKSILTGKEISEEIVLLIFGYVRSELTKNIAIKRRAEK